MSELRIKLSLCEGMQALQNPVIVYIDEGSTAAEALALVEQAVEFSTAVSQFSSKHALPQLQQQVPDAHVHSPHGN
jgi:hypothetical protein